MGQEFTAGSNAAIDWEPWLHANCPRLMLYARQQTRSQEDAEDVLQEALVQLVNTVESGDFQGGKEQWVAYAISAIRNLATDSIRRTTTRRNYEESADAAADVHNPWLRSTLDDEVRRRHVEGVLRTLPPDYAEVLILRIWEELSFRQIAVVVGDKLHTVTSRYRRALGMLRDKLAANPIPE